MKYVIDIKEHPMNDPYTPALYRAKRFRTLVFDEYGLKMLTPLEEEIRNEKSKAYEEGVEEGKEIMKGIVKRNISRVLCKNQEDEKKYKPEVEGYDGCGDCKHTLCNVNEEPCISCKHSHRDNYEWNKSC